MGVFTVTINGNVNNSSTYIRIRANTSEIETIDLPTGTYPVEYLLDFESDPIRFWVEIYLHEDDYITSIDIKYPTVSTPPKEKITTSILTTTEFTETVEANNIHEFLISPLISSVKPSSTSISNKNNTNISTFLISPFISSTPQISSTISITDSLIAHRTIYGYGTIKKISASGITATNGILNGWKIIAKKNGIWNSESPVLKEKNSELTDNTLRLELLVSKEQKQSWLENLEKNAGKVEEYANEKGKILTTDTSINDQNTYKIIPKSQYSPGVGSIDWNVKSYKEQTLGRTSQGYIINVTFTKSESREDPEVSEYSASRDSKNQWLFELGEDKIYTSKVGKKYNITDSRQGIESYKLEMQLNTKESAIFTRTLEELEATNFINNRDGTNYTEDGTDKIKNIIFIDPPPDITFDKAMYAVYEWKSTIDSGYHQIEANISKYFAGTKQLGDTKPLEATTQTFSNARDKAYVDAVSRKTGNSRTLSTFKSASNKFDSLKPTDGLFIPTLYTNDNILYRHDIRRGDSDYVEYINPDFNNDTHKDLSDFVSSSSFIYTVQREKKINVHNERYELIDSYSIENEDEDEDSFENNEYIREVENRSSDKLTIISDQYEDGYNTIGSIGNIKKDGLTNSNAVYVESDEAIWISDIAIYNYSIAEEEYGNDISYIDKDKLEFGEDPPRNYVEFNPDKIYLTDSDYKFDPVNNTSIDYYVGIPEKEFHRYIEQDYEAGVQKLHIVEYNCTPSNAQKILQNTSFSNHPLVKDFDSSAENVYIRKIRNKLYTLDYRNKEISDEIPSTTSETIVRDITRNKPVDVSMAAVDCSGKIALLNNEQINEIIPVNDLDKSITNVAIIEDKVYIVDEDGTFYACDKSTLFESNVLEDQIGENILGEEIVMAEGSKVYEGSAQTSQNMYILDRVNLILINNTQLMKIDISEDEFNRVWKASTGIMESYDINSDILLARIGGEVIKFGLADSSITRKADYNIPNRSGEQTILTF